MTSHRPCLLGTLLALAACSPLARPPARALPSPSPTVAAVPAIAQSPLPPVVSAPARAAAPVSAPAMPQAVRVPARRGRQPAPAAHAATPATAPAARQSLAGQLKLDASGSQSPAPGDLANSVVYFVPAAGAPRPRPGRFHVYAVDRDFKPAAIAVPLGSTIDFENQDDVRHNVFSVTPGAAFDLGYQAHGQSVSQRFDHAGVVLVGCNVHRSMQADVLVVPSAYASRVGADGRFILHGLPAGKGTLYAWNPRVGLRQQAVTLPMPGPLNLRLRISGRPMSTEIDLGAPP